MKFLELRESDYFFSLIPTSRADFGKRTATPFQRVDGTNRKTGVGLSLQPRASCSMMGYSRPRE
jgi:hypothetical protein